MLFISQGFVGKSMRLLVVFTTEYERTGMMRVAQAIKQTPAEAFPFVHFASLDDIRNLHRREFFSAEIWHKAGDQRKIAPTALTYFEE